MEHFLTPTATFMVLALAGMIDLWGVGPDSWRDRIAAMMYLAGIREGWNGGSWDEWTVDHLAKVIDIAKKGGNAYLQGADTKLVLGGLVSIAFFYLLLSWLPNWRWITKHLTKFGGIATKLQLPKSPQFRVNFKMLALVVPVALMADLIPGNVGNFMNTTLDFNQLIWSMALNWLY